MEKDSVSVNYERVVWNVPRGFGFHWPEESFYRQRGFRVDWRRWERSISGWGNTKSVKSLFCTWSKIEGGYLVTPCSPGIVITPGYLEVSWQGGYLVTPCSHLKEFPDVERSWQWGKVVYFTREINSYYSYVRLRRKIRMERTRTAVKYNEDTVPSIEPTVSGVSE